MHRILTLLSAAIIVIQLRLSSFSTPSFEGKVEYPVLVQEGQGLISSGQCQSLPFLLIASFIFLNPCVSRTLAAQAHTTLTHYRNAYYTYERESCLYIKDEWISYVRIMEREKSYAVICYFNQRNHLLEKYQAMNYCNY